ncbi:YhcH/YjgK/YiaL family protein [Fusobacterium sp. PH5-44]|uniref:YhcH/YjgK/YiaL family protein n=1 Tax=unclassified Fusobacterium TaxID=2648384 RepID=UPI003D1C92AE
MIIGKLKDLKQYKGLSSNLDKAIDYALNTNLLALTEGKHEIIGSDIYVSRSSYVGKPLSECKAENHKIYLDLQIMIKGTEKFGYADISNKTLKVTDLYNPEKDVEKYTCEDETVYVMTDSSFAIVYPEDIHRPQIKVNDEIIEKAVIKIKI